MSFLTNAAQKKDKVSQDDDLEEQYERLFPKMGRDFVHRDDLQNLLQTIMSIIDPLGLVPLDFLDDTEARKRALEYKGFLDDQKNGSEVYKDLIKLEDDDE